MDNLRNAFTTAAPAPRETQALENALSMGIWDKDLCRQTAEYMAEILDAMGLPLPAAESVLPGTEGALILLKEEGIVLRIENNNGYINWRGERVENHPMVLQPLGARDLSPQVRIEFCPGCHTTKDYDLMSEFRMQILETGVQFFDAQIENIGLLPLRLPDFPAGVPVVIDRLAVTQLSRNTAPVRDALAVMHLQEDPQKQLYGELQDAFAAAWPEGERLPSRIGMEYFLTLCRLKKSEGHLVDGWDAASAQERGWLDSQSKTGLAAHAADSYARQINARKLV